MNDTAYAEKLSQEAAAWGAEAERMARSVPPDWRYHRALRHNAIMHTADIDALLALIRPGMQAAELGCGPGWLTLALAQRGAAALGLDISEGALEIGRRYYESIRAEVPGTVEYRAVDLNQLDLPPGQFDVIVVKGTLHHLVALRRVIEVIHAALKPGGLLWVSDSLGDEARSSVLAASALMFVLPTHVSYADKIRGLLRFGLKAPGRIKMSMEAEGLSPFEGAGRDDDWLALIAERFTIERRITAPAITGYISAQLNLPDRIALPLLRGLRALDRLAVRGGLLRSSGVVIYARKR
jgi:2-polyprenyl-3-methyl-5-hydroxy-6-metoxy-1,4-benzoquinol methylase